MLRHFKIFVKCELPILICFIAVAASIYHSALYTSFIWDDEGQIVQNVLLRDIQYWPRLFSNGTFYNGGDLAGLFFRPLMSIYFSIIYLTQGLNPFAFHIIQLLLHILNSWLIYICIKKIIVSSRTSKTIAILIASAFLVHPVQVEAITYTSNSQELLFFFFGIVSLYVLTHSARTYIRFPVAFILLLCSLFSKESGVLFIFLDIFYVFIYNRAYVKHMLVTACVLVFLYILIRCNIAHLCITPTGITPMLTAPLWQRLINMPLLFQTYIGLFIYPDVLVSSRHWIITSVNFTHFYGPLMLSIASITGLIAGYYRIKIEYRPHYLFFFLWFFSGVLLHLQIIALDFTLAERWLYMPIVGIIGMLSIFLANNLKKKYILILFGMILMCAAIRSYIRVQDWKDPYILFMKDTANSPDAYDLHINLGVELFKKHRYIEATDQFYTSTQIAPRAVQGWLNLGIMYETMNKSASAAAAYKEGISRGQYPYAFIYDNYATLLIKEHRYDQARAILTQSIRLFPAYTQFVALYNQINDKQKNH